MAKSTELTRQAKSLPRETRKEVLMAFRETELHKQLKELFGNMQPDYTVEVTHGAEELGKDLVVVKKDEFTLEVIGVVVKKGHIRGQTVGEVDEVKARLKRVLPGRKKSKIDEIESQVEQALAHPAKMKQIFATLPVSKVFVVLAGDLSNQARTRLEAELKGNVEVFDVNWLVDKFTIFYPQVFFEGKVCDFLQERIQKLEGRSWLCKKGISLSECFVEPLVATVDLPVELDDKSLALMIGKRKMPFSKLKSILKGAARVILVGDPGVGKSAAVTKLEIDALKQASASLISGAPKEEPIEIPLLVAARDILEVRTAEELLHSYFSTEEVIRRFKVEQIMVDALDEVPPLQRAEVIKRSEKVSRELNCRLVITSRKVDIIDTPPEGFKEYELLPFEFGQALKLFEKVAQSKQTLTALKNGLERVKFHIPMVPLSLLLIIELVEDRKEIPASLTELYDRFFDMGLGRYDKEKDIEVLFEYRIKKSFLAELAYCQFLGKGRLEVPQVEFEKFLGEYASEQNWDKTSLDGFVKELQRAGVVDLREAVTFRHRSFLDYFAAVYLFDKQDELENLHDLVVQIYFDDLWGDVAFFYIGLKRKISDSILSKIFAFESEDMLVLMNKFLSGKLLQAGWNSPTKTKYSGIEKAIVLAPAIRDKFLASAERSKVRIPRIFGDFLVMSLSDLSFASGFLAKEVKSLIDDLLARPDKESLCMTIPLLWSIQRFLTKEELREAVGKLLGLVSDIPDLPAEDQAKSLLFLMFIERQDTALAKTIRKKLERVKRRAPGLFKALLPRRKKGFR